MKRINDNNINKDKTIFCYDEVLKSPNFRVDYSKNEVYNNTAEFETIEKNILKEENREEKSFFDFLKNLKSYILDKEFLIIIVTLIFFFSILSIGKQIAYTSLV